MLVKEPTTDSGQQTTKAGPEVVDIQNSIINEVDTDGDGLKDWEELIWKTDPNNPKTHEGYENDSAYVSAQLALMKNNPSVYAGMGPIETTEDLSKQLFEEYLLLKQTGNLTPDDIARLTQRIRLNIESSTDISFYSADKLKTFPSSDKQKLQKYADELSNTINQYTTLYMQQVQNSNITNTTVLNEIVGLGADIYLRLSESIMKMEVPIELASTHTQYANDLRKSSVSLDGLLSQSKDPLQSIVGLQKHTDAQNSRQGTANTISNFLIQNGIMSFNMLAL